MYICTRNNLITMKKLLTLMTVAFVTLHAMALDAPDFSGSKYYVIQFSNSKYAVQRMGSKTQVQTQKLNAEDEDQLWAFTGSQNNCQIINKNGEYLVYNSTSSRVATSATADASGWKLEQSGHSSYSSTSWEIKWLGTSSTQAYWNQYGGTGIGKTIGLWTYADQNNPVKIIDPANIEYADFAVKGVTSFTPESQLTLWYNQPATLTEVDNIWMEYSLPIGNGQLGASLFGGVMKDEIQFNEKTLWTGTPNDIGSYGQYKNFGSFFVTDVSEKFGFTDSKAAKDYVRYLDIEKGVGGVKYTSTDGNTKYSREYLSSNPDKVIAVRYKAEGTDKLSLKFSLTAGEDINAGAVTYSYVASSNIGYLTFYGSLTTVSYNCRGRVIPFGENAKMTKQTDGILVENADEIVFLITAKTTFDGSKSTRTSGSATSIRTDNINTLTAAANKGWEQIYADHVADFTSYMGRVGISLGAAKNPSNLPTNELVKFYNNSSKNIKGTESQVLFLEQLYFMYGRYLEISASRGVDVPSNLQGIWNNKSHAPWNSDIHTNINVQMNYWPSEPTNLSEMHVPFLNYIITNAAGANWKKAATNYAKVTNGWTVFTESNIYGGMSTWGSNYFVANAWYTSHLWQHYRYTRDDAFLLRAFPAMWSAAQFWMERMIEDKGYDSKTDNSGYKGTAYKFSPDGTFVAPNEYSPEQDAHNKEDGTAHAQQLIYELLCNVRDAVNILGQSLTGMKDADMQKLQNYLEKTDQGLHTETYTANTTLNGGWTNPRNGVSKGATILREWKYSPYDVSTDPAHRHLSHLMALFPLSTLSPSHPMFEPAVNSLKLRGDDATGWSMGWKVNLWARAQDGDHAHKILHNALKHSTAYGTNQYAGGIYYNLYDSHSPFQIDGNFGVCSGVAEMLLQSHTDTLQLLPALPSVWAYGHINGLKAVGNFTVDQTWKDGKLSTATVQAVNTLPLPIYYKGIGDRCVMNANGEEIAYKQVSANCLVIDAEAGETYTIDMSKASTKTSLQEVTLQPFRAICEGNQVMITGDPDSIRVFNLAGAELLSTSASKFQRNPSWGVILVQVKGKKRTETIKIQ